MTDIDHHRHGLDPGWQRREIARAEAQDAEILGRPALRVSPDTIERRGAIYAEARDGIRPWLLLACALGGGVIYAVAGAVVIDWIRTW